MVSAEHSVAWYAEKAGDARDGGELFRAIDLPAMREGKETVLDLAPDHLNQNDYLDKLRVDLLSVHGAPLGSYIEFLIALGPRDLNKRVRTLIRRFVEAMPAAGRDSAARQIAKHVGVLYAGAMLGIEVGILPWSPEHALRTHRTAFDDAFAETKIVDPLIKVLDILKTKLRDKIVERKPDSTFDSKDHAGYWELVGGEKIIVVHASQLRSWFDDGRQLRLILEWLSKQGYLKHRKGTNGTLEGEDFAGATLRWPRGVVVRSFSFADPFAEAPVKASEPPSPETRAQMIAGSAAFLAHRRPRPYKLGEQVARRKLANSAKKVGKRKLRRGNKEAPIRQLLAADDFSISLVTLATNDRKRRRKHWSSFVRLKLRPSSPHGSDKGALGGRLLTFSCSLSGLSGDLRHRYRKSTGKAYRPPQVEGAAIPTSIGAAPP